MPYGKHQCSSAGNVGVTCYGDVVHHESDLLRLVDKNTGKRVAGSPSQPGHPTGRLEVLRKNEWGAVCDDHFDKADANVACYDLGFEREGIPIKAFGGNGGENNRIHRIWLDDVNCKGDETRLEQCCKNWGEHNCEFPRQNAGLTCYGEKHRPTGPDIRLCDKITGKCIVKPQSKTFGRVEML